MAVRKAARPSPEGDGVGPTLDYDRFATIYRAVVLAFLAGWIVMIGRDLLIPIIAAVIAVYVLTTAASAMSRLPVLRLLPIFVLRLLVLVFFTLALTFLAMVVAATIQELIAVAPTYRANLEELVRKITDMLGFDTHPTYDELRRQTLGRIDVQGMIAGLLGPLTSFGGTIFLVIVYAGFLMGERSILPAKLAAAFPEGNRARLTASLITDIDQRIGDYLTVKTLINVLLGAMSYAILWAMGIDFALFWAVLIGLFNYIPYVGSLVAVALPVIVSLAQFGSLETTIILAILLSIAQGLVGNIIEPRTIGRQLNLSPFVVLVALSFWSALWGLPGAILAIPMTAMLTIIFAAFPATKFIAILLSQRVERHAPQKP